MKPNPRTDEDIAKEVKDALTFDPATEAYEINVTVDNGMVTLTGTVDSRQEKKLTKEVVKGVKGIKAIKNNIEVRLREVRSDAEIETEIERQFEIDPWINDEYVNVEVNDGEVTLKGKVLSGA
ncbi:MAG: BON domain-containing protein [Aliifodinibius sp.]|nr:BON domain-containing protein [Fodinibius sp.]NIY24846.1 BON domain-containing protein [Fodinibius sp.]